MCFINPAQEMMELIDQPAGVSTPKLPRGPRKTPGLAGASPLERYLATAWGVVSVVCSPSPKPGLLRLLHPCGCLRSSEKNYMKMK